MKLFQVLTFAMFSSASAEVFPELPDDGAIPKTVAWEILDKQWKIIEPALFSKDGQGYVGRAVRFECKFTIVANGIEVITPQGTKAVVTRIPKVDMKFLKRLKESDSNIIVEGTLTKVDLEKQRIEVRGGGIRGGNN